MTDTPSASPTTSQRRLRAPQRGGRRVVNTTFVTLDGYMVGPDEDMSWVIEDFDRTLQDDIARFMGDDVDTYLFGRVTYQIFEAYWPHAVPYDAGDALIPAAGREDPRIIRSLNESSKVVFSRTLAPPSWQNTRVVREGLEAEVLRLKAAPGKLINIQGSASIVQALMRADLIDEHVLYVHPVVLGRGKPLFAPDRERQDFERVAHEAYDNGVLRVVYRRREQ